MKTRVITNVVNKAKTSNEIQVPIENSDNKRNMHFYYDKDNKVVPEFIKHPDLGVIKNEKCTNSKVYTKGVWVTLKSNWFEFEKIGNAKKVSNAPESLDSASLIASRDDLEGNKCNISESTVYVLSDSKFAENITETDDGLMKVRKLYFPIRAESSISV